MTTSHEVDGFVKIVGATAEGVAAEAGVITDEGAVVVDAVALPEATDAGASVETPEADAAKS